jgi:hypothetical protein
MKKKGEQPTYWGWDWPPCDLAAVTMPPLPADLQTLVAKYGGYHRIPNDVWADHYNQMITVWVWLTMRHFPPQCRSYSGVKLKYPRPRQNRDLHDEGGRRKTQTRPRLNH